MSTIPRPRGIHEEAADLCARIARAVRPELPPGFRGKLEISAVDGEPLQAHHIAVQFRPQKPKEQAMKP